jgi:hypothetical protein
VNNVSPIKPKYSYSLISPHKSQQQMHEEVKPQRGGRMAFGQVQEKQCKESESEEDEEQEGHYEKIHL